MPALNPDRLQPPSSQKRATPVPPERHAIITSRYSQAFKGVQRRGQHADLMVRQASLKDDGNVTCLLSNTILSRRRLLLGTGRLQLACRGTATLKPPAGSQGTSAVSRQHLGCEA